MKKGCELSVANSLFLPMGWTNLPPIICSGTETIADFYNKNLSQKLKFCPHKLDTLATNLDRLFYTTVITDSTIILQPYTKVAVPLPSSPDPHLPRYQKNIKSTSYVDVVVDDLSSSHKALIQPYYRPGKHSSIPLTPFFVLSTNEIQPTDKNLSP